jgi:surfactin synthase thioesterase subunit
LQTNINTLTSTVGTNLTNTNTAIAAVQADVDANETASKSADATLQTNINTLTSTVGTNLTNTNTAIAAVQADVDANETAANTAIALKENSANKSSDTTLADATNTKFPTELAVKTFVTGQISTSNTATNSAIAAVQADVDANETASKSADATLQTNINTLTSTVGTNLTNTNTAIAAVQSDVDANEMAADKAIALKENSANKSDDVTLADATNTKFPTELAVKTFVTGQISTSNSANTTAIAAVQADVDANETAANTAIALKENSANKSSDTILADATNTKFPTELAVKTFVTGQISTSNTATNSAIAAVQADVDANETASNSADATLQSNINTLGATVTSNAATAATATALKENSANKSSDTNLADATNTKFPTELAVKTYVDTSINSGGTALTNEATIRANTDLLKEDLINKSNSISTDGTSITKYPTVKSIKDYVDAQITTATIPDATSSLKGKIQLSGDLSGNASSPLIANNAITTIKILDSNVTDAKIATISGSKVIGNILGNAATATKLAVPITINGVSFDGSANISFSTNTVNTLTFNNGGAGDASGTNFNGSLAKTISYNTIGASPLAGSSSITTTGTISNGTWNGNTIAVANGGTGATTLTSNGVLIGNGISAVTTVAPGLSGNVLTSNGTNWTSTPSTILRETLDTYVVVTAGQTSFILNQIPSANCKLKMFRNGVKIRATAYSFSTTTLTYIPANNGNTSLDVNDLIEFYYFY